MLSASVQTQERDPQAGKIGSVQRIDLTHEPNSCLLPNPYARAQWQLDSDAPMAEYEEAAFQIAGPHRRLCTGACAVY
jgi:hypothetical protein